MTIIGRHFHACRTSLAQKPFFFLKKTNNKLENIFMTICLSFIVKKTNNVLENIFITIWKVMQLIYTAAASTILSPIYKLSNIQLQSGKSNFAGLMSIQPKLILYTRLHSTCIVSLYAADAMKFCALSWTCSG